MKIKEEYGLVILKPDGVQKGIEKELLAELKYNEIKVIYVSKKQLSKQQVLENFTSDFNMDMYADYISRSEVSGYLVQGHYAGQKIREIKQKIRSCYGYTSRTMENLIHTADNGNEYALQFQCLFPELDGVRYSKFADMNVRVGDDVLKMTGTLFTLSAKSNLSWVGVVTSLDHVQRTREVLRALKDLSFQCLVGVSVTHHINGEELEIIGYLPPRFVDENKEHVAVEAGCSFAEFAAWVKSLAGFMVLGYTPAANINVPLLQELKAIGVKGVIIYDARRNMRQVEDLEDLVDDEVGMVFSGGTAGVVDVGKIALDRAEFEMLTQYYWDKGEGIHGAKRIY